MLLPATGTGTRPLRPRWWTAGCTPVTWFGSTTRAGCTSSIDLLKRHHQPGRRERVQRRGTKLGVLAAPNVADACVLAGPDEVMGEKVGAVLFGGQDQIDVAGRARPLPRQQLADFKVPAVRHGGRQRAAAQQPAANCSRATSASRSSGATRSDERADRQPRGDRASESSARQRNWASKRSRFMPRTTPTARTCMRPTRRSACPARRPEEALPGSGRDTGGRQEVRRRTHSSGLTASSAREWVRVRPRVPGGRIHVRRAGRRRSPSLAGDKSSARGAAIAAGLPVLPATEGLEHRRRRPGIFSPPAMAAS